MGRALGIDFGDRRMGLALSDPSRTFAAPLEVVEGEEGLRAAIRRLIADEDVDLIVLGLPLNMDGTAGPKARQAMELGDRLRKEWGLPVETWDERLTTVQAHAVLGEGGLRGQKRAGKVDKVAAQILLQTYLDRQKIKEREGRAGEGEMP